MSGPTSPLLDHMYSRFGEVFGSPSTMLELDSQSTLRPDSDPRRNDGKDLAPISSISS